jgi:hypothetical protein
MQTFPMAGTVQILIAMTATGTDRSDISSFCWEEDGHESLLSSEELH